MSFIAKSQGVGYEPGYFLAHEECTRETREIAQTGAITAENDSKYVKMGTVWPSNDANAIGIIYEDVDVTNGNMPGSVVTAGTVIESRLADTLDSAAKTALEEKGFKFVTVPTITRPDFD